MLRFYSINKDDIMIYFFYKTLHAKLALLNKMIFCIWFLLCNSDFLYLFLDNIIKELESSLSHIQEIRGYLKIARSYPLISLNFLRDLWHIRGEQLDKREYAFSFFFSPIYLWILFLFLYLIVLCLVVDMFNIIYSIQSKFFHTI